jgi:putative addiction module component (TIGR02574 family)
MKLNDLKIDLAKRILGSESEETLRMVDEILGGDLKLSAKQKAELDRDWNDHQAGKGQNMNWNAVKANARKRGKA